MHLAAQLRVPYLEVVVQNAGILCCSLFFATEQGHVQKGQAAHAVNRNTPKLGQYSRLLLPAQQSAALRDAGRHASALLQSPESSGFLLLLPIFKKVTVK